MIMSRRPREANAVVSRSRQIIVFAVCLVFLTFIHQSEEFSFSFGGFGGDGGDQDAKVTINKLGIKQRAAEKKFKFHKLERIEIVDDDHNDDDEADNDNDDDTDGEDEDKQDDRTVKGKRTGKSNDNRDDDDDDDDDDENDDDNGKVPYKKKYSPKKNDNDKDDDDNNEDDDEEDKDEDDDEGDDADDDEDDNDDDKYTFSKVRKASKLSSNRKFPKRHSKISDDDDDDTDSWWASVQSILSKFSFSKTDDADDDDDNDKDGEDEKSINTKSNSIIEWLSWLGEKFHKDSDSTDNGDSGADIWWHYLNRWPFNTIFLIGKPAKLIRLPNFFEKMMKSHGDDDDDEDMDDDDEESDADEDGEEDEHLLYSLPLFVPDPNQVEPSECRQQLELFQEQLISRKLWTLQMLDSTAKLNAGMLRGHINQFGDFEMCTDIRANVRNDHKDNTMRIRGKYCLAHVEVRATTTELRLPVHMLQGRGLLSGHLGNPKHLIPRYGIGNLGICVPHLCPADVVQETITQNLHRYNSSGIEIQVEVDDDDDCYVKPIKPFMKIIKKDKKLCVTLLYCLCLLFLPLCYLLWEHWLSIKLATKKLIIWVKSLKSIKFMRKQEAKTDQLNENDETMEAMDATEATEAGDAEEINETTTDDMMETDNQSLNAFAMEILMSISPKRTAEILLYGDSTIEMMLPLYDLLKVLSTCMLYLCLKFLMLGHLPITNRDEMIQIFSNPFSILIRHPMIYTDILLLINGCLSAYELSEEMEQKSFIQLLKRLSIKFTRYLPIIYMLISFQTWILPYLSAGPLWSNLIGQNGQLCEQQWWRNLLHIQNILDYDEMCAPGTTQIALEVQLYLLGPLVVWLFYTVNDAGFFIYGALHAMSVAARYSVTNQEHLSMVLFHGINVSKFYRTATYLYSSPISRATPYLLGIGAGIFYRMNKDSYDLGLTRELKLLGWFAAVWGMLWCLWSPAATMRTDYVYSASNAAAFASWCPLIFGLSLCWFVFVCNLSEIENSFVKRIVSSQAIAMLSRLTIPLQLVTYIVVLYNTAEIKEPHQFHIGDLIDLREIVMIVIGSLLVTFFIDIPFQNIHRLITERLFTESTSSEKEDRDAEQDGAAVSDYSETSEDVNDPATTKDPDTNAIENIWGSDPEEEEESRYFARRHSSLNRASIHNIYNSDRYQTESTKEEEEDFTHLHSYSDSLG